MSGTIQCPHCRKSIGGPATDGGLRVRLAITLIDSDNRIHGPCPACKKDVTVAETAALSKTMAGGEQLIPGLRIRKLRNT
jgi:hypothetical protein